jgi:hypothetical protein
MPLLALNLCNNMNMNYFCNSYIPFVILFQFPNKIQYLIQTKDVIINVIQNPSSALPPFPLRSLQV